MVGKNIKHKVNYKQMLALRNAHVELLRDMDIKTDHDVLLHHHLQVFADRFEKMSANIQNKYGLKFTELEALAFCQIWSEVDVFTIGYGGHVIQEINNTIDKQRKNLITSK